MINENVKLFGELEPSLRQGRISKAFGILENAINAYPSLGKFAPELEHQRSEYGYMRSFTLRGLPDPTLPQRRAETIGKLRTLADSMDRELSLSNASTLYFNTLRYELSSPADTLASVADEYRRVSGKLSLVALAENPDQANESLSRSAEALERRLFNKVWTLYPLTSADDAAVGELIHDMSLRDRFKSLMVSALLMGGLEFYDERRMRLLMDIYAAAPEDVSDEIRIPALCALLVLLWIHRSRQMSARLSERLDALRDMPEWMRDVRMAAMQFVRSRDTERITRKFREEVMPEMMRLRPEIEKLKDKPFDPEAIEENPEWADMLEKTGIADKLREMQELQQEGADVMMATFSTLKSFPFFNDIANWFLPFDPSHSMVSGSAVPEVKSLLDILETAPMLCDNDKYSIALSLSQIPPQQRELMISQLRMQNEQLDTVRMAGAAAGKREREEIAVNYVRNLYRFFKLFRRKGEFTDPFASGLNIPGTPALKAEFDDPDILTVLSEFYFRRGYHADALEAFRRLGDLTGPDAGTLQKMGYCEQSLGNIREALACYEQANLLDPADKWTLRRLAWCYKSLQQWDNALNCYTALAENNPDDSSLALNIGLCHVKMRRFDVALNFLLKAEFLASSNEKATRALAWCTLLAGDFDRCVKYTATLLASASPRPKDFLNAGHLSLLTGHPGEAAEHYAEAIRSMGADLFIRILEEDTVTIPAFAGVNRDLLSIVADSALDRET